MVLEGCMYWETVVFFEKFHMPEIVVEFKYI